MEKTLEAKKSELTRARQQEIDDLQKSIDTEKQKKERELQDEMRSLPRAVGCARQGTSEIGILSGLWGEGPTCRQKFCALKYNSVF